MGEKVPLLAHDDIFGDHVSQTPFYSTTSPSTSTNTSNSFSSTLSPVDVPTFKGQISEQDMDENYGAEAAAPSAPPITMFEPLPGYSSLSLADQVLQPPPYEAVTNSSFNREPIPQPVTLNSEEAREALLHEVSQHCCWGSGPAKKLQFTNIIPSSAFHYRLDTFTESRSVAWAYEAFSGQPIDGPQNGIPPQPWDIMVPPRALFQDQMLTMEIPHTASLKTCHHCAGYGRIRCHKCLGRGKVRCGQCRGAGHQFVTKNGSRQRETCVACYGSGRRRCSTCVGHGQVACPLCRAAGRLKCFARMTVRWVTHSSDYVVEKSELPPHLITGAAGRFLFQEENEQVPPIMQFPEAALNQGSQRLVSTHLKSWPAERILRQRHSIRSVPVSEAHFMYKDEMTRFWIFGTDRRVHVPDYPAKLCWGCTLS